jgi:hypothetical protein
MLLFLLTLSPPTTSASMHLLFKWCTKDEMCAKSFHIRDMLAEVDEAPEIPVHEESEAVFRFLAVRWVPELRPPAHELNGLEDLRRAAERRFVFKFADSQWSAAGEENSVRIHWLHILRLSAKENHQVHCGANQRLIVSPETLTGFCACIDNRNCGAGVSARSHWNVAELASISVSVLILFWLIVSLIDHAKRIHFFQEFRSGFRTPEETHVALIKSQ